MIKMHDVLFGEFIEIEDDKNILVVDCGCDNQSKYVSEKHNSFQNHVENWEIMNHLIQNQKYVMISHFHKDHINGFEYLTNTIFKEVFVPYISRSSKGAFIFKKALLTYLFGGKQIRESAKSYLSQVELAAKLSGKHIGCITPVGRGDKFNIGKDSHEILWPPKLKSINIDLNELNAATIKLNNYKELSNIISLINELFEEYNKYLDVINNDTENNQNINYNFDRIPNLLNNFYELVVVVDMQTIKRIKIEVEEINKIIKQMNNDINKTSIVDLINYQKAKKGERSSILLTGDITKDIFENILVYDIPPVTILKAPHHGTSITKHYSDELPEANYVLISNGKYSRRKIVDNYKRYLTNGQIECTHGISVLGNNVCKIYELEMECPDKCRCRWSGIIV